MYLCLNKRHAKKTYHKLCSEKNPLQTLSRRPGGPQRLSGHCADFFSFLDSCTRSSIVQPMAYLLYQTNYPNCYLDRQKEHYGSNTTR